MPDLKIEPSNGILGHDVKWDFYGQRLATAASSDNTIKIIGMSNASSPQVLATLIGHRGPVLQLAWAHPKFGSILASCSHEGRVLIWKEVNQNEWKEVHVLHEHNASINCISWAPHELTLSLACGSSDGSISVLIARSDGGWDTSRIGQAHPGGVTSVSWGPAVAPGPISESWVFDPLPKLASGGRDGTVKVWKLQDGTWKMDCVPLEQNCQALLNLPEAAAAVNNQGLLSYQAHSDLARDAASVNDQGHLKSTIASPSEDHVVLGDGEKKESRNHSWSIEDDELLINAWLNTPKDSSPNNDWGNWTRITTFFEENRKRGVTRNRKQLNSRWHRISRLVKKFAESYDQASQECQDERDENEIMAKARKLYRSENDGHYFQLEHAWILLKDEPKWKASMNTSKNEGSSKRMKVSESGTYTPSSNPVSLTSRDMGSSQASEVHLNIDSAKKPAKGKGTSEDERKPKGVLVEELHTIKSAEVKKAVAMEELAETKQMEIDMQLIYEDTSSMNEEQLQFHVQLVQKLKQKYLI